ncbi:MAG TPA: glycosyltransferase [Gammaproteobacteria bacterium]|nr:glycosyltransferase [Gammaproteobacteria bacterium]
MSERIVLLSPNLDAGGAERVMLNLMRAFVARGFAVELLLMRRTGVLLPEVPEAVRVIDLDCRKPRQLIRTLRRYLRRTRPTALITAHSSLNWAACLAVRLSGSDVRCLVREESTLSVSLAALGWTTRWLRPRLLRWFCGGYPHISVSKGAAANYVATVGLPASNVSVVYNPVLDKTLTEKFTEPAPHAWFGDSIPVVLAVGRLCHAKGFDVLLDAFSRLVAKTPARLLILGEGFERKNLTLRISRLGLDGQVDMPGFVANPWAYMRSASLFVLSSRWEGLGNVVVEALACGAPVVATDCPHGPREILDGGRFGLLTPPEDPEALADAMQASLTGQAPREDPTDWLRQFGVAEAARRHLELLELA